MRKSLNSPDHPRSRGVYGARRATRGFGSGSSPLARGLLAAGGGRRALRGIIPARAGFTFLRERGHAGAPDHPRSRGVYHNERAFLAEAIGSSPLARGLRGLSVAFRGRRRIIPARAGFTAPCTRPRGRPRDHPRSRGVYVTICLWWRLARGSSPLARGLPPYPGSVELDPGIIPARAGFTAPQPRSASAWEDHPRSRGVYHLDGLEKDLEKGSSPLARGLHVPALI